jgi:hypothetical protein
VCGCGVPRRSRRRRSRRRRCCPGGHTYMPSSRASASTLTSCRRIRYSNAPMGVRRTSSWEKRDMGTASRGWSAHQAQAAALANFADANHAAVFARVADDVVNTLQAAVVISRERAETGVCGCCEGRGGEGRREGRK